MTFAHDFLTCPDSFFEAIPREDGRGRETLILELTGGPYLITGLLPGQRQAIEERYVGHLRTETSMASPTVVRVMEAPEPTFREFDPRTRELTIDLEQSADRVRLAGWGFAGEICLPVSGILWTPVEEGGSFRCLFNNFFRVLVAYRSLTEGGVLFHSAAVVDEDEGFLFLGHSGAGKTTLSRSSRDRGRLVLSDDMNAVVVRDHRLWVEKLPFTGELGRTPTPRRTYPLKAICRLEQGRRNSVRPIPRGELLACMLACSPFVNRDPHRLSTLLDNLEQIARKASSAVLRFCLNEDFFDLLHPVDARAHRAKELIS